MAQSQLPPELDPGQLTMPVRIVGFDESEPQYATGVAITVDPAGLQLVFTRFLPPIVNSESDLQRLQEQGYYTQDVVARIVLPPVVARDLAHQLPIRIGHQQALAEEHERRIAEEVE